MRAARVSENVRPPAVAGTFYPRDPGALRAEVSRLLAAAAAAAAPAAPAAPAAQAPKALIAPHAGYIYSGQIAAASFATLRGARAIERIVVIGPAHYVAFRGIAVPSATAFATPLGRLPVDQAAIARLDDLAFVVPDDRPHAPEHALEVELPFLQALLPSARIVPLVVGDAAPQEVAEVLRRLRGGAETLIVVSSDLSHYHAYDTARRLDAATAALIERGAWTEIGPDQACGWLAVAGLLIEMGTHGGKGRRLALCNSGDTAGPRDRVVGYGAWTFEERAA
jgi:AmmeMemoRadiSam system protein B